MPDTLSWRRLITESAAVVASILLAFAIDAAWDRQQTLGEEQELLRGLEREFVESQRTIGRSGDLTTETVEHLMVFLGTPDETLSDLSWDEVYLPLVIDWQDPVSTGFLDATTSSGKLALIRDAELRAALAQFATQKALLNETVKRAGDLGAEAGRIAGEFEGVFSRVGRADRVLDPTTLAALRGDARITGLATARITQLNVYLLRLGFFENAVNRALTLIRGQLTT